MVQHLLIAVYPYACNILRITKWIMKFDTGEFYKKLHLHVMVLIITLHVDLPVFVLVRVLPCSANEQLLSNFQSIHVRKIIYDSVTSVM